MKKDLRFAKTIHGYKVEYVENDNLVWDEYPYINCYETGDYIEYALGTKQGLTYKEWEKHIFSGNEIDGSLKFYNLFCVKKVKA